jgi:hypothetical protein
MPMAGWVAKEGNYYENQAIMFAGFSVDHNGSAEKSF